MRNTPAYIISLVFTILVTLAAFVFLLAWLGSLVKGIGNAPVFALIPWKTLVLVALAAGNCVLRKRVILRRAAA
jgi:hypothetical protein